MAQSLGIRVGVWGGGGYSMQPVGVFVRCGNYSGNMSSAKCAALEVDRAVRQRPACEFHLHDKLSGQATLPATMLYNECGPE